MHRPGACFRRDDGGCSVCRVEPFIALTDKAWFDFLAARSRNGILDEVNFWSPRAARPMRQMDQGELVFFRLKKPYSAIAQQSRSERALVDQGVSRPFRSRVRDDHA